MPQAWPIRTRLTNSTKLCPVTLEKFLPKVVNDIPAISAVSTAFKSSLKFSKIWSIILGTKVTEEQVALLMVGLKVARLIETPTHQDSMLDIAGYAAIMSECIEEKKNQTKTTEQSEEYLWHKN